jgi:hypothetical protein
LKDFLAESHLSAGGCADNRHLITPPIIVMQFCIIGEYGCYLKQTGRHRVAV